MGGLQYLCVWEIVGLFNKGFKLLQRPKIMQITPLFVFLLQNIEINIFYMVTVFFARFCV